MFTNKKEMTKEMTERNDVSFSTLDTYDLKVLCTLGNLIVFFNLAT